MTIGKHTIATITLDSVDEIGIVTVKHLLEEVEEHIFRRRDIIVNADTGEVIERNTVDAALNLLEVLLNDRSFSHWELPD